MANIKFPYGKGFLEYDIPDSELRGVLVSALDSYVPEAGEDELVLEAMKNPVGSERLSKLAVGKKKVVIIASDHTRPVPSKHIIPFMLKEIREGNPDADITILIATGCHRETTREELSAKFGDEILANEKIVIHDCLDENALVRLGTLPSGGECIINKVAAEADLLVAEGFIEPHFFAGFSGGRKSVLPGIASRKTVLANHCSEFIASQYARTGIIENNPIHADMLWAAKAAKLSYIVNVVINAEKKVMYAVAGDTQAAHEKGCEFLKGLCGVKAVPADIVITTNGGYPLDQNIYQSVKGMTAAEASVKKGGVIIMLSRANDGHGGKNLYDQAKSGSVEKTTADILKRNRNETLPDQWQLQVLYRVLSKATVVYVSESPDDMIRDFHMIPAHSVAEAFGIAKKLLATDHPSVTAIPDGISVMVYQ